MGRQHLGMDRPGVRKVPEGGVEQGKTEETGCEVIPGAPMTPAAKGFSTCSSCELVAEGV